MGDAVEPRRIPLVPLRDDVVFPKLIVPLSVGRRTSIAAITAAMEKDKQVLLGRVGAGALLRHGLG